MSENRKKSRLLELAEFGAAYFFIQLFRIIPFRISYYSAGLLGNLLYVLLPRRRRDIALTNVRNAFAGEMDEEEVRRTVRRSCQSLFLTAFEIMKAQSVFKSEDAIRKMAATGPGLEELFSKAKNIHDESGGCIFVTPHTGNWELLPAVSSIVGIPLVIVARPLDNAYLENLFYANRTESGQMVIPKRNAMFVLQRTLQQGKSIGMLTDQSTMKGVMVDFFGRKAPTTPVPAVLAITKNRPVVVVACCRTGPNRYEGFVSDPIWPQAHQHEKEEIIRITSAMNRDMESIIRKYPGQYFWLHNRWKRYEHAREVMS